MIEHTDTTANSLSLVATSPLPSPTTTTITTITPPMLIPHPHRHPGKSAECKKDGDGCEEERVVSGEGGEGRREGGMRGRGRKGKDRGY